MTSLRAPAVIADVDGTLCNITAVRHFVVPTDANREGFVKDFDSFHAASIDCPPHQQAIDWCADWHERGHTVVVVSARMDRWCDLTTRWLHQHMPVPFDGPFMRRDGDIRSDRVVKKEIHRYLSRHYDIRAAIDDNPQIVQLWEQLGVPVTVIPGWYEDHPKVTAR